MYLENFEDFGQFCMVLNIVRQKSASGPRRAQVFQEGFTRIAKSKLDTQKKGEPLKGDTSLPADTSGQVFWVGPELKVGVKVALNRLEIFQPSPRESYPCGVENGSLQKFSLGIQGQYLVQCCVEECWN